MTEDPISQWSWLCLAALLIGAYGLFLSSPVTRPERARIRLPAANFFLGVAVLSGVIATFARILEAPTNSLFFGWIAIGSWACLVVLALTALPHSGAIRATLAGLLLLVSVIIVGLLFGGQSVAALYDDYHASMAQPTQPGDGAVTESLGEEFLRRLGFLVLPPPEISCGNEDLPCKQLQQRLRRLSEGPFFAGRLVLFFILLYSVIRYYGSAYEEHQKIRRVAEVHYDLRGGVIAQSASVLSLALALFLSLALAGVDFAQLGIFGGLAAAGLSVALKDTIGNFAAGMVLLWDGSVRKGDVVTIQRPENPETGGTYGVVEDVRLRYTLVRDRDTVHRLIPNVILISSIIENWTHDKDKRVRLRIPVPVPYGSKLKEIKDILESSCYEVRRVLRRPPPRALVVEFADSAIIFSLRFWIADPEQGIRSVISDVYSFISERLKDIDVTIPFPQLDVHLRDVPITALPASLEDREQTQAEAR